MKKHVVTVVGAGNGGCTIAADLSLKGHEVRLLKGPTAMYKENFELIKKQGGIYISRGSKTEFASVDLITTDFEQAMDRAEIVCVVPQTVAHESLAPRLAPLFKPGMIVLVDPGYGGSLIFSNHTSAQNVIFAEGTSLPLDCRIIEDGKVCVLYENVRNPLGFFPAKDSDRGLSILMDLYSNFTKANNVLETALHNPNLIVHTTGAIMNVARIEYSKGEFWMYKEGFTPSIWNILHRLDAEKMAILSRLGLKPIPYLDMAKFRNSEDLTVGSREVFDSYSKEGSPKGPESAKTRYITEDVPMGLGLMHSLGEKVEVKTPICDALITIASIINQTDYWQQARTLKTLGLNGLTIDKINRYLETGEKTQK